MELHLKEKNDTTVCSDGPCLSHALEETKNWYGGFSYNIAKDYPWIIRGNHYRDSAYDSSYYSIFSYHAPMNFSGRGRIYDGFRLILSVQ